jgi:hypothetical protein
VYYSAQDACIMDKLFLLYKKNLQCILISVEKIPNLQHFSFHFLAMRTNSTEDELFSDYLDMAIFSSLGFTEILAFFGNEGKQGTKIYPSSSFIEPPFIEYPCRTC